MVCYDIADNKRRERVAELLLARGTRVQYSVFECRLNPHEQAVLRQALLEVIDVQEDDVRFYPLCADCRASIRWQGRRMQTTAAGYRVI
jgi:CRISPR-associated protein Cas2